MARFRVIEVWPMTGRRDRPLTESVETDAWVKSARRVAELYSEALALAELQGPVGSLRFMSFPVTDGSDEVRIEVDLDRPDGTESARVWVPAEVARLSPAARGRLVLDVIERTLTELAPHRDWSLAPIVAAREHVLDRSLCFEWASPWRTSPDRRLQARAVFRLADDGYGRAVIEIRDRTTEALVARSAEGLAYSTLAGFKRSAATLTWEAGSVRLIPYIDLLGEREGELTLEPAEGVTPLAGPARTGSRGRPQTDGGAPSKDRSRTVTVVGGI